MIALVLLFLKRHQKIGKTCDRFQKLKQNWSASSSNYHFMQPVPNINGILQRDYLIVMSNTIQTTFEECDKLGLRNICVGYV